jgi:hypothetical protein
LQALGARRDDVVVLGVLVSLTSIGSGALAVVFLVYLYPVRPTPPRLVATDIVHAILLTLFSELGHLLIGNVVGALLSARLPNRLPEEPYALRARRVRLRSRSMATSRCRSVRAIDSVRCNAVVSSAAMTRQRCSSTIVDSGWGSTTEAEHQETPANC